MKLEEMTKDQLVDLARKQEVEMLAARQPLADSFVAPFDLTYVITWLENGCDPKEAAKELRIYRDRMSAPAEPVVTVDTPEFQRLLGRVKDHENLWGAHPEIRQNNRAEFIAHIDAHTARAVAAAVEMERAGEMDTIRDRDQYHEWADRLADAIAKYFGRDIGEHSNANCPWAEALDVIEEAEPMVSQPVAGELPPLPTGAMQRMADAGIDVAYTGHPPVAPRTSQPVQQPAAVVGQEPVLIAYAATDLDGRVDVGLTPDAAKKRAGHGCDTVFGLYDIGNTVPAAGVQGDKLSEQKVADRLAGTSAMSPKEHRTLLNGDPVPFTLPQLTHIANLLTKDFALQTLSDISQIQEAASQPDSGRDAALVDNGAQAGLSDAARVVLAERRRQIEKEGFGPAGDDEYVFGELRSAALCYISGDTKSGWPWDKEWWKPTDDRHDLIKAGALVIAEIERLDRLAAAKKGN